MKCIHKYKLEVVVVQTVLMAKGAIILALQLQDGDPHIWAVVDTEELKEEVAIHTYGTGVAITEPGNYEYIDTYQYQDLVLHVMRVS